ncbi:Vesicle transport v-SNARE 11, partial [Stylosanthes scabra]|nr:Vesicle transport v-SNARE 11 [Stylosanthes scabra]
KNSKHSNVRLTTLTNPTCIFLPLSFYSFPQTKRTSLRSIPRRCFHFSAHRRGSIRLSTMSNVFEGYERQYCELSANLSKKCTAAASLNGEQKKQKVSEVKAGIDEAEALIRKMDLEARSLQPNIKAVLLAKLREYKSDLNNLKSEVKKIVSGNLNPSARDELLESGMADAMTASADQKSRLMMSTERLNKTSERVKDSRRTMLETEELGVSILQDLHSQRQSLLHAHNTLHGVDDNLGKSKKILTNMSRRMDRNKWIISFIVFILVVAIGLILYFKLAK